MQKIHERIMRYEELQIAKKETEALKEVRGKYNPKKKYLERYEKDVELIRSEYPNYVPNKDTKAAESRPRSGHPARGSTHPAK